MTPKLLGILNVTEDSFSDGGAYFAPDAAIAHARKLAEDGADIIDIGAAASNPKAKPIPPKEEIDRLAPIVEALRHQRMKLSIDSFAAETQAWALDQGVDYLNDIHGFPRPELYPALASSDAKLIVMHAVSSNGPARREDETPTDLFGHIVAFFEARIAALTEAGVARVRLILDPGMGLFLGRNRDASFTVLRRIAELKQKFNLPVLVSVSRKSFLRPRGRTPEQAGAATLAVELYAAGQGVDYIRTHDPGALRDGLAVLQRLEQKQEAFGEEILV